MIIVSSCSLSLTNDKKLCHLIYLNIRLMSLKKGLLLIEDLQALLFPLKIFQTSRVMADVNSWVQSPEGQGLDQQSVMLLTEREQVLWQAEAVESTGLNSSSAFALTLMAGPLERLWALDIHSAACVCLCEGLSRQDAGLWSVRYRESAL